MPRKVFYAKVRSSGSHLAGKRPSMKDVAEAAGVTPMTVCIALRDGKGVSEATKARVREVAEKLGYVRNVRRGRNATFVGAKMFHVPTEADVTLARVFCRPWMGRGIEPEELYGEAMIALMRAAVTFDPDRKASFETHLLWTVRSRLRSSFGHKSDMQLKYGITFREGDAPLLEDGQESLFDMLPAEDDGEECRMYVRELLSFAESEEQYVLERRYLDGEFPTEISRDWGRSLAEVVRLIDSGLEHIRRAISSEQMTAF